VKADPGNSLSSRTVSTVSVGTLESASVTIGYGVTDAVIVAADVQGAYRHQSVSDGGSSTSESQFAINPRLEYMFPGSPMFIGAQVGFDIVSTSSGSTHETDTLFAAGGALGAHVFLSDGLSLDPVFTGAYVGGSGTLKDDSGSLDIDLSGFVFELSLGLSGWL
jgi:hypothetical protein